MRSLIEELEKDRFRGLSRTLEQDSQWHGVGSYVEERIQFGRLAETAAQVSQTSAIQRAAEEAERSLRQTFAREFVDREQLLGVSRLTEEMASVSKSLESAWGSIRTPAALATLDAANALRCGPAAAELARINGLTGNFGTSVFGLPPSYTLASSRLAEEIAEVVTPYQSTSVELSGWASSLRLRLANLDAGWLGQDTSTSIIGFAHIARLSDAVHFSHPYSDPVGEIFLNEFGAPVEEDGPPEEREAAALSSGFNPGLIAFEDRTYDRVVVAAGFQLAFAKTPTPAAIERGDPEAEYNLAHHELLTQVEQRLRQLVGSELRKLDGGIKRHVPGDVMQRWKQRQQEDRDLRRPVYDAIQYADFMDIADIIRQKLAWTGAFAPIFLNRDDIIVSMQRLHPIRKSLAHGRPLCRADSLTLFSEAARILKALGVQIFQQ